jgi:hypothetical protein
VNIILCFLVLQTLFSSPPQDISTVRKAPGGPERPSKRKCRHGILHIQLIALLAEKVVLARKKRSWLEKGGPGWEKVVILEKIGIDVGWGSGGRRWRLFVAGP